MSVQCAVASRIPSKYGTYRLHLYHNTLDAKEHLAVVFGAFVSRSLLEVRDGDTPDIRTRRGAINLENLNGHSINAVNYNSSYQFANSTPHSPASHYSNSTSSDPPVLVRIHSCCFTGETIASTRCDCGEQLAASLTAMGNRNRGILLYLKQEGRDIGLHDKLL